MTTLEKISLDIKNAMKSGDNLRKNVLRMVMSDIKYAQAAVNVHQQLDEEGVLKVIMSYHKKLKKAYEDFPEGDKKKDLLAEITLVEEYLPKMLSSEDMDKAIEKVLASNSSTNFGELMRAVLGELGSTASAKDVSEKIKKALESRG